MRGVEAGQNLGARAELGLTESVERGLYCVEKTICRENPCAGRQEHEHFRDKRFPPTRHVPEVTFQARVDVQNIQNRSQLADPTTSPTSSTFGQVTNQTTSINRFYTLQGRFQFWPLFCSRNAGDGIFRLP